MYNSHARRSDGQPPSHLTNFKAAHMHNIVFGASTPPAAASTATTPHSAFSLAMMMERDTRHDDDNKYLHTLLLRTLSTILEFG
jgi:hypothetical protein